MLIAHSTAVFLSNLTLNLKAFKRFQDFVCVFKRKHLDLHQLQ